MTVVYPLDVDPWLMDSPVGVLLIIGFFIAFSVWVYAFAMIPQYVLRTWNARAAVAPNLIGLMQREVRAFSRDGVAASLLLIAILIALHLPLALGLIIGGAPQPYEARILESECLRFASRLTHADVCANDITRVVRYLNTYRDSAFRQPPGYTREDHAHLPEHPDWKLHHFTIQHVGGSIDIRGANAAVLVQYLAAQNSQVELVTEHRKLEAWAGG